MRIIFRPPRSQAPVVSSGHSSSVAPAGKPEVSVKRVQEERFVRAPNFSHTHHECPLLLGSLEAAVTKFGSGVYELELDDILGLARCVHEQRLEGRKPQRRTCTCTCPAMMC